MAVMWTVEHNFDLARHVIKKREELEVGKILSGLDSPAFWVELVER